MHTRARMRYVLVIFAYEKSLCGIRTRAVDLRTLNHSSTEATYKEDYRISADQVTTYRRLCQVFVPSNTLACSWVLQ